MRLHKIKKLKKLKGNRFGKDFVVGDIHGCYDTLMSLLNKADFDPDQDRLFSVGDLIDRGPDSIKCLSLLNEPYFYAVKGNHETMFCQMVNGDHTWFNIDQYWDARNGGDWTEEWFEDNAPDLKYWRDRLSRLPYVIEVSGISNISPYWVVHAELWCRDKPLLPQNLSDFLDNATTNDLSALQWSRQLSKHKKLPYENFFPGPIYCGHTPISSRRPNVVCGHMNLDGGAGKSAGQNAPANMMLYCHNTNQLWVEAT